MQEVFPTLVWIVAAIGVVVAIFTLIGTGRSYREIGGGGIVHDSDRDAGPRGTVSTDAERDDEIRQMLEARNVRRARRGDAPQDVEAELSALTRPAGAVDESLREEIRRHVVARNARRVRAGGEPLDVDEEIERRIRDLT